VVFKTIFSNDNLAADMFLISVHNDLTELCEWRGFKHHCILAHIEPRHKDLLIEQIIVLACTVSAHRPSYNLYKHQCYWYAGVIWDIIVRISNTTLVASPSEWPRGQATLAWLISLAPTIDEEDSADTLHTSYVRDWVSFCAEVKLNEGVSHLPELSHRSI
jgi:hypothetical protein